jgi:hypothetical protein
MDKNIVFQVMDRSQESPAWHNSKIVYILACVPERYDVTDIVDAISAVLGSCTVRYARLGLEEKIDLETVNAHDGGYYQHRNPR